MNKQLPVKLMLLLSGVQGGFLTLLYRSVEDGFWPGTDPIWLNGIAAFFITFPLVTLFSVTRETIKQALTFAAGFSLILAILAAYTGFQQTPVTQLHNDYVVTILVFTGLIASFKALMYIQQWQSGESISYGSLFKYSWRNAVMFAECGLFTLIFFGILHLGASLFAILEITFFKELLRKDWFVIPTLTLAYGCGLIIFRNIIHTVDTVANILQTLIKFLLPALTIVSLGFLVTLPFTGLEKLWQTGSGSLLVLWLQALTLFFLNTVYQGEPEERPYSVWLHRVVSAGIFLLPIYSVIAAYGLYLRIDQYGLTVSRLWGILICLLLAVFAFGYAYGIAKKRDAWLQILSTVNIRMGWLVLGLMLLLNSPLLNFQSIVTDDQMERYRAGEITADELDVDYMARSLGRQGYIALVEIQEELQGVDNERAKYISQLFPRNGYYGIGYNEKTNEYTYELFLNDITYWPNKSEFDASFVKFIYEDMTKHSTYGLLNSSFYFIATDMNKDGKLEYLVIKESNNYRTGRLWQLLPASNTSDMHWLSTSLDMSNYISGDFLQKELEAGNIKVVEPKWQELHIGNAKILIREN